MYQNSLILAAELGGLLKTGNLSLATAESCTGGLIGALITEVAGSSAYYLGGVCSYSLAAKSKLLGIPIVSLEKFGAVSQATVLSMAENVRALLQADIGLATTGIAGPGGGTPSLPLGTVWCALAMQGQSQSFCLNLQGNRQSIRFQAVESLLQYVIDHLRASFSRV